MKSNSKAVLGLTLLAGLLTGAVARAEDTAQAATSGLPAHHRERAYQGRGRRKSRPFAGYSGGGQPVVDHQYIGW